MREGSREDGGGEGEVGEGRRKNVRFMELGKLKVIKSKDYSTAKLLKFLREVEGFRLVLNSKALRGLHIYIIHFFTPFLLFCPLFSLHLQSSSTLHSQYQAISKFLFRGIYAPPISPFSPQQQDGRRCFGSGDRLIIQSFNTDAAHRLNRRIPPSRMFITVTDSGGGAGVCRGADCNNRGEGVLMFALEFE